jgi:hypothetical protein
MTRGQAPSHGKGQAPVDIARCGSPEAIQTEQSLCWIASLGNLPHARNDGGFRNDGLASVVIARRESGEAIQTKQSLYWIASLRSQ